MTVCACERDQVAQKVLKNLHQAGLSPSDLSVRSGSLSCALRAMLRRCLHFACDDRSVGLQAYRPTHLLANISDLVTDAALLAMDKKCAVVKQELDISLACGEENPASLVESMGEELLSSYMEILNNDDVWNHSAPCLICSDDQRQSGKRKRSAGNVDQADRASDNKAGLWSGEL